MIKSKCSGKLSRDIVFFLKTLILTQLLKLSVSCKTSFVTFYLTHPIIQTSILAIITYIPKLKTESGS